MSLLEFIAEAERAQLVLTVCNADSTIVSDLRERFADRAVVVVEDATTADGTPRRHVTLRDGAEVVASVDVQDLEAMLDDRSVSGVGEAVYRPVLDHLPRTLFTTWDERRLLSATREIEDRAWRLRRGCLDVGFQRPDVFRGESATYEKLASGDIDIRAYVHGTGEIPSIDGVDVTVVEDEEIDRCWFVAYDGADTDDQQCALLAAEDGNGAYRGFWTYEHQTVDDLFSYLDTAYPYAE